MTKTSQTQDDPHRSSPRAPKFRGAFCFYVAPVLDLCALVGFIAYGKHAESVVADQRAHVKAKLAALVVPKESLQVDLSGARLLGAIASTGGRVSTHYRIWTALQTKDWMLLNASAVSKVCGQVLGTFARRNGLEGTAINAESMDMVLSAAEGKTLALDAYIPRFIGTPERLDQCPGFSFDAARQVLLVGTRTVAVLADEQPGLVAPAP